MAGRRKLVELSQLVEAIPRDPLVAVKSAYHSPRGETVAILITVAAVARLLVLASICNEAGIGR